MRSENVKDIAALGGNPVYFLVGGLFWFFGQPQVMYQLIVSLILCYMLTTLFRITFFRERPKKQQYKNFLERIDASSFPSLHSMRAAVIAVTIGMFFNQPLVWILAAIAAVSVAITRVLQKRHHKSDVITGLIIGVAITVVSPLMLNWVF